MVERSIEMIEELKKLGVGERPIIWVGHSKGGLFIKQILVSGKLKPRSQIYSQLLIIFDVIASMGKQ